MSIYDILQEAVIDGLQDPKDKDLAGKVIHVLERNTFLNRKNIEMLDDLSRPGNGGILLNVLKLSARSAGSAIMHAKPQEIGREMNQMFGRIQKEMKDQQDSSGQDEFSEVLSGYISEQPSCPGEWIISGNNIEIQGGKYSYRLAIRSNGTLSFDNDLEISYQGIDGRYQLNYEIEENGNHIMIVTGHFENIIVNSPLLEKLPDKNKHQVHSHIHEDEYSYQLILRTREGLTFKNKLRYFFNSDPHGFSINYAYDLLTDKQTLKINPLLCSELYEQC